jgi:hypothetical protein
LPSDPQAIRTSLRAAGWRVTTSSFGSGWVAIAEHDDVTRPVIVSGADEASTHLSLLDALRASGWFTDQAAPPADPPQDPPDDGHYHHTPI